MQQFTSSSSELSKRLNAATIITTLCKYGFGTLLVLSVMLGSQAFRSTTPETQAAAPSRLTAVPDVSRHSTLSADVFHKYVNNTGQRMYPRLSREIVDSAIKYSEKYDLSPVLVLAVMRTESEFYPFALSKQNAKGLMQINPEANLRLLLDAGIFKEPTDIFDPQRNIEAGCFLLRRFINESSDFNTALDKYLGADSVAYKAQIHDVLGKILLLGITEDLNRTSQHKIETAVKVEASPKKG